MYIILESDETMDILKLMQNSGNPNNVIYTMKQKKIPFTSAVLADDQQPLRKLS